MAADANNNIDVMLSNLPKFKTDANFIDDLFIQIRCQYWKTDG